MKTYKQTVEKPRLVIKYDDSAESPRQWDNLGYFITCEKQHNSPDDNEDLKSLIQNAGDESSSLEEHIEKIKAEMKNNGYGTVRYITPVCRYEHGNVVYRRGTAHGFDYSNCGFYIVTKDEGLTVEQIEKNIDAELETYTQWMNGEVYGFMLYDEQGEQIESVWGFYDIEDIREYLPDEWKNENLEDYLI